MNLPAPRSIHSVSELAEILRALVEDSLPRVWVEGEVSNFSRPASGHWYFTLKDSGAQIRCAMFRNANHLVRPQPANGDRVLLRAQVSFYTARGDLQLICEHLEPAGEGALLRAFEELKRRLSAEGLFDAASKRPLPVLPQRIGLITSATGAAVQDVLAALARRFPLLPVVLWPVPVQGAAAAPAIARALRELPARADVDAILLVRGGGSLEDLWAFNEERVARAIRACAVPVVTGVGHEIDTTIADYAADLRAPTPTAAAELVSPDRVALAARVEQSRNAVTAALERRLSAQAQHLTHVQSRLLHLHPRRALLQRAQRVDQAQQELISAVQWQLQRTRERLTAATRGLANCAPAPALDRRRVQVELGQARLLRALRTHLHLQRERVIAREALLQGLNPRAVLDRGYAIARNADGAVLRDPQRVGGEEIELILARGALHVRRAR